MKYTLFLYLTEALTSERRQAVMDPDGPPPGTETIAAQRPATVRVLW